MPPSLPMRSKLVAPAGQHLVRVALVADVEHEPVAAACRRRSGCAVISSTAPRLEARCPPVCETCSTISARSSCATRGDLLARQTRADPRGSRCASSSRSRHAISRPQSLACTAKRASSRSGSARAPKLSSSRERFGEQRSARARARRRRRARARASRPRRRPRRAGRRRSGRRRRRRDAEARAAAQRVAASAPPRRAPPTTAAANSAAVLRRGCTRLRSPRRRRRRVAARNARSSACPPTSAREPAACASSRERARARRVGSPAAARASSSKARASSASPASTAIASPYATCTVGRPRRRSSSSMHGRSSCTSE